MSSDRNAPMLHAMEMVENYSISLNTLSWIWGGYSVDIYENRILREHEDLDYLTLNSHGYLPEFTKMFENSGWRTDLLENGDLQLRREEVKIHLGHVELSNKARWTHNGDQGSIWFPPGWLNTEPVNFCGVEIHVVTPEFQFVMIEHPQMLNPNWRLRKKDILARDYLRNYIERKGISPQSLFEQVSDV
jgi:hypothetical protein